MQSCIIFLFVVGKFIREMHFHISTENISVKTITDKSRDGFKDQNLVLITANGMLIEDSEVTRGKIH